jgi:hypothetical protein
MTERPGFNSTLRDRVANSVDRLLEAIDATQDNLTPGNLDQLREDADYAMRAIGRVLLEVERLANEQD